jgi:hypothetical protein
VSSAGAVFKKLPDVPPITLAAWRLQLTSLFLAAGLVPQWRAMPAADRRRALSRPDVLWTALSGACLAVHFGAWVASLKLTSLPHALLLVCMVPVLLVIWALLRRQPISKGEVLGTLLALAGARGVRACTCHVCVRLAPKSRRPQRRSTMSPAGAYRNRHNAHAAAVHCRPGGKGLPFASAMDRHSSPRPCIGATQAHACALRAGAFVLAAGAATGSEGNDVTVWGDVLAFAAAVAVVGYLQVRALPAAFQNVMFALERVVVRDGEEPALPALCGSTTALGLGPNRAVQS